MKRLTFLAVCLFFFSAFSFAQAPQNQGCTLEQTVNFQAAVALARVDYMMTVSNAQQQAVNNPFLLMTTIVQAFNSYKAKVEKAANALPNACWLELATAESHVEQCQEPRQGAEERAFQAGVLAGQKYRETGNREAFEADMREISRVSLRAPLPRVCWFEPVQLPAESDQAYCSQAWSEYAQCYQANQNTIVNGGTLRVCYRPICVPPSPNNQGTTCAQQRANYENCLEEFKKCTVRTHGRGPCPYCQVPTCQ
jgi:hypothetical protein